LLLLLFLLFCLLLVAACFGCSMSRLRRPSSRRLLLAALGLLSVLAFWSSSEGAASFAGASWATRTLGRLPRAAGQAGNALPELYIYDHCPFCVRARIIFGMKNIKHNLVWMANDDVDTPTALVGKKISPILQLPGESAMFESLDIVRKIDMDPAWGPPLLKPASAREDLDAVDKRTIEAVRLLLRPRVIRAYLPEFAHKDGRTAYLRNHPIADPVGGEVPEKAAWLAMGEEKWKSWYDAHFENSPALLAELNSVLPDFEGLIHSEDSVSPGGASYDDIVFFAKMRTASLIKGLKPGPRLQAYMERMSDLSQIPLYSGMAV